MKLRALLAASIFALLSGCGSDGSDTNPPATPTPRPEPAQPPTVTATITHNDLPVHDPSVIRDTDGTFYVFGSHLASARSTDLMNWESVTDGVDPANPLWSTIPADGTAWTGIPGSWAADVIRFNDGRYGFYYSFCGVPTAGGECNAPRAYLGLATADSIEGPYVDQGIFLRSGMTASEIEAGMGPEGVESYDAFIHPNTIDPDAFYDKDGKLWLLYGSYSGGIFILEMDPATGKPLPGQGYGTHLAGGDHSAIEGSYILYSPQSDYYYLFMSFGGFMAADGYNIRVARSRQPNGPYLDAQGNDVANARGNLDSIAPFGVKVMGGFEFIAAPGETGDSRGYLSPGHNSAYYDAQTQKYFLVTHTRFPNRGEEHSIRVHEMFLNENDWLVVSPHRYVPIEGTNVVAAADLVGDFKLIELGKDINREAKRSVYVSLTADGKITGNKTGSYSIYSSDPNRITIRLNGGETYEGRVMWQWDEASARLTPTFTGVSSTGASVWGTQLERQTTAQALQAIADDLSVPETVKETSIALPTDATRGADIVWTSSHPTIINSNGAVSRPNVGEGDQIVTLTATITLNGQTHQRNFLVTVPQRQPLNRVAHFTFENTLAESLGNFTAATATGDRVWNQGTVGFAAGHTGQAVDLPGNAGVRLPSGLISSYEYTVSFWIHPRAITGFTPSFFAASNEQMDEVAGTPFSTTWISYVPQSWDGNTMLWSGSESWFDGSAGMRIPENAWSHLAFAVKAGVVSVYIDGVQRFSGGQISDFFTGQEGVFALGVNYWDLPFNGLIDELKIYEAALSAEEVAALDIDEVPTSQLLNLSASILSLGDVSSVRNDLTLPRTGPFAAAIEWTSSHPNVISPTGRVTRPGLNAPDAEVTLTATITLNGEQTTKDFVVTVSALGLPTPVAAYDFEDTLSEATGAQTDGTIVGSRVDQAGGTLAFGEGRVGRALSLDGSTGVRLPDNLLNDHSYSISLWLRPSAVAQYTTALFGWATDSSWISLVPRGPGAQQHTMLWSGTAWFDGTFGAAIPVDEWTHVVVVVNGGTLQTYINGELTNTMNGFPDVFTPAAVTRFAIGVNYWDAPYQGLVDQLKFFDQAIVDEDVMALYTEQ